MNIEHNKWKQLYVALNAQSEFPRRQIRISDVGLREENDSDEIINWMCTSMTDESGQSQAINNFLKYSSI